MRRNVYCCCCGSLHGQNGWV